MQSNNLGYIRLNGSYIYHKSGNPIYLKVGILKLKRDNHLKLILIQACRLTSHLACSQARSLILTSNVNWTCSPESANGIQYCMKTYCYLWCLSSWHSPTHGCRYVADGCMPFLWWSNISIARKYGFIIKVLFANNL